MKFYTVEPNTVIVYNVIILEILEHVTEEFTNRGFHPHVTSGCDRTHIRASLHYQNRALDFRTLVIPVGQIKPLLEALKLRLPTPKWDVLYEMNHLHVERNSVP